MSNKNINSYRRIGYYLIPNLTLLSEESRIIPGKRGMIHKAYLERCVFSLFLLQRLFYDSNFSAEWVLSDFKTELNFFLNFVYDDSHYGKMWQTVIYNDGHLGVRYFKLGNTANALKNFKKMCEFAIKIDNMDRITTMHSVTFEGNKFDTYTLGITYVAKMQVKELLTEKYPLSEKFKESDKFKILHLIIEKMPIESQYNN